MALKSEVQSPGVRMDVPFAAREIGEFLGSAILGHRCFT